MLTIPSVLGQIWGNMLSSFLFKRRTVNMTDEVFRECGALYCPSSYVNNTNLDRPSLTKVVDYFLFWSLPFNKSKISNDQELMQSEPKSHPQNQSGK